MAMSPSDLKAAGIGTLVAELVSGTAVLAPACGAVGGAVAYGFVAWRRRNRGRRLGEVGEAGEVAREAETQGEDDAA